MGKFTVASDAKKLIENICPADELIKSMQDVCSQNPADFLIKLEKASRQELDKLVMGFKLSGLKNGNQVANENFIPAQNMQDIECLVATAGEIFQKLS